MMVEARPAPRKSMMPWMYDEIKFYDHQINGVRKLARMPSFLLGDDMGLGKSLQSLAVVVIDIIRGRCNKVLVVAPVSLRGNWADEINKFTTIPYVLLGEEVRPNGKIKTLRPAERSEQIEKFKAMEGPAILITNYEQIKPHLAELNSIGLSIAIFDEAHYIKNHKSQRTKAAHGLKVDRKFLLTGTPMLNQVNELWSLLYMIDKTHFSKYWSFLQRYAVFGGFKDKEIVGVKNEKELTEKLKSVMLRRLKSEVLDLPEVQYITRKVDLLPEQRRLYDMAANELQLEGDALDSPMEIENALTKFLRLKQICGTTKPFTGQDHSAKLDLAISDALELVENGHKVVVFTQFRDVLEAYADRLDTAAPEIPIWELHGGIRKEDRQEVVRQWSNSEKPGVIVCMLQVASVGLNMTAARHAQFIDKLFVPGLNQQAVDRLHRIGASETQAIQILEYICRNTIESRVEQILTKKKKLFETIVNEPDFKRRLIAAMMKADEDDEE